MRLSTWLLVSALILGAGPAAAGVWEVPAVAPTVAEAVALAAPGDTVLIDCGIYLEHDILLTGGITILGATGDPDCVVIDAGSAGRAFVSDDPAGEAHIEGLTVTGGSALGPSALDGWGGGMLFIGAPPTLVNCRIVGNTASAGGGLALGGHGLPTLTGCEISDNTALYGGGLLGQVVAVDLTGCTFRGNFADSSGGALYASLSAIGVDACTFHGNGSTLEGGALYGDIQTAFTLTSTILSFSTSGEAVVCDETSFATASCCDVYGNAGGDWVAALAGQDGADGNFSADPRFCDAAAGNFGLRSDSPCLPGGHPVGDPCGIIGAWSEACGATSADDRSPRPETLLRAWPNPFRGSVRLAYELPAGGVARIAIYDVEGRLVRAFDPVRSAGTLAWDGADAGGRAVAAGSYYIRLESPASSETHHVLLIR